MYKLNKGSIVKKNKHFQAIYQSGISYANKMLVLYILPNHENGRQVGFAAGKRLGCAVIRNRAKRLLREVYRLNQNRLADNMSFLLVARKPLVDADREEVTKAFLDLSRRAKILIK
ncbi:hypothetical protein P22_1848 [Propionispora sp. 2/2-37]|uniref:ribonuclease P protein component n=1 Tax=Propionispora sp. 2/2-37 TaxID=1677858 RepID=UPI0006BB5A51|nr:ribonuclease P protein component [Propionispora sp. 2/2-37]CUH95768.1 hypothetical protein P22_1848 [Propionispora sp. 2/2-37]